MRYAEIVLVLVLVCGVVPSSSAQEPTRPDDGMRQRDRVPPPPRGGGGPPHGGMGPGAWDGGEHAPGGRPPLGPPAEQVLHEINKRDPELGRRLRGLQRRSPEALHQVMLDALMASLEETLDRYEAQGEREGEGGQRGAHAPPPPRRHGRPGHGPPPLGPPPGEDLRPQFEKLERRHAALERESRELGQRVRALRAENVEQTEVREQLEEVVRAQFAVRGELRELEIQRLERDVKHIQSVLERMREDLKRRAEDQDAIIERRVGHLVGDR